MENQHRQIKGYRELSQPEIDLMNEIKELGVNLGALVSKLEVMQKQESEFTYNTEDEELVAKVDSLIEAKTWTQSGKMKLKEGLMALTRAVARPTFF